jgi:Xaa-Pro dipeptidase
MSSTQEQSQSSASLSMAAPLKDAADRRADVDAKQAIVAKLLQDMSCDGLLVLDPDNFAYLTSGGIARSVLDVNALPALYFSAEARWALCANVDSQRLFDEELDGLGFQLKEWPWHWGRTQLLSDLCQGRAVACDQTFGTCKLVADHLQKRRCILTEYERACLKALGQILGHALEATGRTLAVGETEREVAGQMAHRLYHRGTQPLMVMVAADSRGKHYRQCSFTTLPIRQSCQIVVAARKYGLCAMASRIVCFGQPDVNLRKEHDAACRVSATYIAGSWPDSLPKQILAMGRKIYQATDFEHEWLVAPQGHVTGRLPVEVLVTPNMEELLQNHWAVTWNVSVGAASSCDTFLISEEGPKPVTPVENWPLKRIRIQGADFVRPDILVR